MLKGDCLQSTVNHDPCDRWYMTSSPPPYCWVEVQMWASKELEPDAEKGIRDCEKYLRLNLVIRLLLLNDTIGNQAQFH